MRLGWVVEAKRIYFSDVEIMQYYFWDPQPREDRRLLLYQAIEFRMVIRARGLHFFLITLVSLDFVYGNAGPSETTNVIVGEPIGLTKVAIGREDLEIDFRSLASGGEAQVTATYQLVNASATETLQLAFAFGSDASHSHTIEMDGVAVTGKWADSDRDLPSTWWPPKTTPPLRGDSRPLRFGGWSSIRPLVFDLTIPAGTSVLTVSYAEHVKIIYARPAMYRQFAYILAPAKSWSSFQDLNLSIRVPKGWEMATNLNLKKSLDTFSGRFESIPVDAIEFTLRPPIDTRLFVIQRYRSYAILALFMLVIVGSWRRGRKKILASRDQPAGRSHDQPSLAHHAKNIVVQAIVAAFVIAFSSYWVSLGLGVLFPMSSSEESIRRELGLSDGYTQIFIFFGIVLLTFMTLVIVFVQGFIQFYIAKRAASATAGNVGT